MVITDKQYKIIIKLIGNLDRINEILDNLKKLEIEGNKDSITYKFNIQNLQLALQTNDELLQNDIFDYHFIKDFKEHLTISMNEKHTENQKQLKRLIRDLQNMLETDTGFYYSRDLNILTLCILENYIISSNSELLNKELIKIKYEFAFANPEFTKEFMNRNFEFVDNLDISDILMTNTKKFNSEIYLKTIIELCASDLLSYDDEAYQDITKAAKVMYLSFKIQAAIMFLKEDITWDFFEDRLNIDEKNKYSINILKSTLIKKNETRKLVPNQLNN